MSESEQAQAAVASVLDDEAPEVARSYADALLNAASKEGTETVDQVLDELSELQTEVLDRFPAFADLLAGVSKSEAEKDQVLSRTLDGRLSPVGLRFLRVLNRHGRFGRLGSIVRSARATWDRRQNRIPVLVKTAVALENHEKDALEARLSSMIHGKAILQIVIDPSLIGGLIVQVGDDVYDVSVRNRLEQLRQRLIEGKTHEIQGRRDHFSYSE